ncbi:MAG: Flagellar filament 30.7 kDa core protein [Phycisphaerae bacterium]|nr:Flagellar filament 30.7 kDa core protein [Phycisphaerae bacterium]
MSLLIQPAFGLSALRAFQAADRDMRLSLERLSTGRRINRGSDDPAGLIAVEAITAEIRALEAQQLSASRVDSYATIAEGDLSQASDLVSELRGKLVAAGNSGALSDEERAAYQTEIDSLVSSIERSAGSALERLEGLNLPDDAVGDLASELSAAVADLRAVASGGEFDVSSGKLEEAMSRVDAVMSSTAELRGSVGAYQRYALDAEVRSSQVAVENLVDSRSRIADTDYALETANLNLAQIKRKASAMVLKIARNLPENVLHLLSD